MADTPFASKLTVPPLGRDVVSRRRLFSRLDQGLSRRLVLLSASAGCGKTTLLVEWANRVDAAVAWLSLDEGDNDVARFSAGLLGSLKHCASEQVAAVAASHQSPRPPGLDALLTSLANQLAGLPREVILVLDDYHLIHSPPIHQYLTHLLDRLPPNLHLYISTRADPPLPVARLRTRNQLLEIRVADLRFRPFEVSAFLIEVMGLELSASDSEELGARTEGWIAGLQLAGLSLQGARDPEKLIAAFSGSHEYVADYLVDEVLRSQPGEVTRFLLQTSILPRLCAPLCDALTGEKTGQAMLERLRSANLFISPLDSHRHWYAYHRLFADLLTYRLEAEQAQMVPELHRRAALWHRQQGHEAEAIAHLLSGGDLETAADAIEQVADATLLRSETMTLLGWLRQLPDDMVWNRPGLGLAYAWALMLSSYSLQGVEGRLSDLADAEPIRIIPLQAFAALFRGRAIEAHRLALSAQDGLLEGDHFLQRVTRWILLASRAASTDLRASSDELAQGLRMELGAGGSLFMAMSLCNLAELYMRQGRLQESKTTYERALALAVDELGDSLPVAGMALFGLADLAREWNCLEEAEELLLKGLDKTVDWAETGAIDAHVTLARVRLAQGERDAALAQVERARQLAAQSDATHLDDLLVNLLQARIWLGLGNSRAARQWLVQAGGDLSGDTSELGEGRSHMDYHLLHHRLLTLARIHLVEGHPREALRLLDELRLAIERRGWDQSRREMEVHSLRALALWGLGRVDAALMALESALAQAEPGGYVRSFVDEGPEMATLLQETVVRGVHADYATRLLAAFPSSPTKPTLVESLSPRELELLSLVAEGLTNQEVADRLIIAVGTVKAHTSNIYGKLGVSNRVQAVARARDLRLI